jgi:AcrR family transcriptional regulator
MPDTPHRIIEAAILVFNEDYSAPLETVAERASVTRRTLHRHFTGRDELLASCAQEIQRSCAQAMTGALDSSPNPVTQLENMLYACVDCGTKYAFFSKLHTRPAHQHSSQNADCVEYDTVQERTRTLIRHLRAGGLISPYFPTEWVITLFQSLIASTITAQATGGTPLATLKQFAWSSFSKGIGIVT